MKVSTLVDRWEFKLVGKNEYEFTEGNVEILWNNKHMIGSYAIDGKLAGLIKNEEELDDLMSQFAIY